MFISSFTRAWHWTEIIPSHSESNLTEHSKMHFSFITERRQCLTGHSMRRGEAMTLWVSASQVGQCCGTITGDFWDAKNIKWLNSLSKGDCFSHPRSLVVQKHYLITLKITHVAFFLIVIWFGCEVPCWPSGACWFCPMHAAPPTASCANTGRAAPETEDISGYARRKNI